MEPPVRSGGLGVSRGKELIPLLKVVTNMLVNTGMVWQMGKAPILLPMGTNTSVDGRITHEKDKAALPKLMEQ